MSNTRSLNTLTDDGRYLSRALAWLIGFFAFLNVYPMQSVLPQVMKEFGASPLQAGLTVGATVFAVALLSPFAGMLSDAWGRKGVLCFSLFALAAMTALIPVATSLTQLVIFRFFQGLAIPGIIVVIIAYISDEFDSADIPRITTAYIGGTVIGGFSGRFFTGHLSNLFGWRIAFMTLAGLTLTGALVIAWRLPASRRFVANHNVEGALHLLRGHLRRPTLLTACAVGFCVLFSLVSTFTYVSLHLAGAPFNFSAAAVANIFMVYLVGGVVTPLCSRLIIRFGFRNSIIRALAFSAFGLLLTLIPSVPAIVLGLIMCSSGVFACQSATYSFIAASVAQGRSLATGLYSMSFYTGGAAGSWLAGLAFEAGGWTGTVATVFSVQMLAATIAWFGYRVPGNRT